MAGGGIYHLENTMARENSMARLRKNVKIYMLLYTKFNTILIIGQ
jgi:hypothetical protein